MPPAEAKRLIVTADDFGLSLPVNEAIETAHRQGISEADVIWDLAGKRKRTAA